MELTSRQWSFYNLLKSQPDKWFTQKEICDAIPSYHWIDDDRNHCADIGNDRILINESFVTDKIIVTKKHCFKIATVEEYIQERTAQIKRLKNIVAQIKAKDTKYERNGQRKLFNNILEELKPENEQFHETFVSHKQRTPNKVGFVSHLRKHIIVAEVVNIEDNEKETVIELANGDMYNLGLIDEYITPSMMEREPYNKYSRQEIK